MRAAIFGAGATGTVLGAFITAGGGAIDLITRNSSHVAALKSGGAHITGGASFCVPVSALTPDEMSGKYDIIFLMTKQQHNAEVFEKIKNHLTDDGAVCTLQNGLPEKAVSEAFGKERCLGCAISWGATLKNSGVAELTSSKNKMNFALGSPYGDNKKLDEARKLLSLAGRVEVQKNFIGARWAKLCINAAFSPLSAITGMTFGEVARDKLARAIALKLMREGFAAAKKSGVKLAKIQGHDISKLFAFKPFALAVMPKAMSSHKDIISGMYFDLKAKRQCEADYINGEVVRASASAPVNSRILQLIREIESGSRDISYENIKFILQ